MAKRSCLAAAKAHHHMHAVGEPIPEVCRSSIPFPARYHFPPGSVEEHGTKLEVNGLGRYALGHQAGGDDVSQAEATVVEENQKQVVGEVGVDAVLLLRGVVALEYQLVLPYELASKQR